MVNNILSYVTGISHIAILVADIQLATKQYELLGFTSVGEVVEEEGFGILAQVMRMGSHTLELLAPLNDASPLCEKVGGKSYAMDHICYTVSNIHAQIDLLKKNRFLVTAPLQISVVWNKRIVLMANRKMGVIELIEQ